MEVFHDQDSHSHTHTNGTRSKIVEFFFKKRKKKIIHTMSTPVKSPEFVEWLVVIYILVVLSFDIWVNLVG